MLDIPKQKLVEKKSKKHNGSSEKTADYVEMPLIIRRYTNVISVKVRGVSI